LSKIFSWFLVAVPPAVIFYLGLQDFTRILGLVGSLGVGIMGTLVILMARKMRKNHQLFHSLKFGGFVEIVAMAAILIAVVYEIWNLFV